MSEPERTADGHHLIIDGRRWRASDPRLPDDERQRLVDTLMAARRDVGTAKRGGDADAEREARSRVQAAKVALGERGPEWWGDADARRSAHDEAVGALEDAGALRIPDADSADAPPSSVPGRTDRTPTRTSVRTSNTGASA